MAVAAQKKSAGSERISQERIQELDTGFLSCTMASPCHELPWELVAEAWHESEGQKSGSSGERSPPDRSRLYAPFGLFGLYWHLWGLDNRNVHLALGQFSLCAQAPASARAEDSIPDPSLWGGDRKKDKGAGKGRQLGEQAQTGIRQVSTRVPFLDDLQIDLSPEFPFWGT